MKRMHFYDRLQLETISESDLLPSKIKAQAAADIKQLPKYSHKNTETDKCALTGHLLGCVNDYKINRKIFRDLAIKGNISGIKFWRYPNYSRWDKEKLIFRLIQLGNDSYYQTMTEELCRADPEFADIYKRRMSEEKADARTNDYVWCMRRNFTPDKWNDDYRF